MIGTIVKLKPQRADAYGFDRSETYRVIGTKERAGYKTFHVYLEGGSMVAPLNAVLNTEIRNA